MEVLSTQNYKCEVFNIPNRLEASSGHLKLRQMVLSRGKKIG